MRGAKPLLKRCGSAAMSVVLAAGTSSVLPGVAAAEEQGFLANSAQEFALRVQSYEASVNPEDTDAISLASEEESLALTSGGASSESSSLPSRLSLVDDGFVTSIKLQGNWSTCWAFSTIAASETSILSELKKTAGEINLDLSERALVNAVGSKVTSGSQAGEGFINGSSNPNAVFDGATAYHAISVLSSGKGLVDESTLPYKNEEGDIRCQVMKTGWSEPEVMNLTQSQIAELRAEEGTTVTECWYSANYTDSDGNEVTPTWTTSDVSALVSKYDLENANLLAVSPKNGAEYAGNSDEVIAAVKSELNKGRAVACSMRADPDVSSATSPSGKYMNVNTWSQYTYDRLQVNHGVTIVGYDDNYAVSNFNSDHQPEKAGAWLVKNSWGAKSQDFPNQYEWGLNSEGYFWVSYCDESISTFVSYDYDTTTTTADADYDTVDQYDLTPINSTACADVCLVDSEHRNVPAWVGNIYNATEDRTVTKIGIRTGEPNTTVSYKIYALDDDAKTPVDGTEVSSEAATFDYAGYHRIDLAESDCVPLREGQKYSVVYSLLSNEDGLYYYLSGFNTTAAPTDAQKEAKKESSKEDAKSSVHQDKYDERYYYYVNEAGKTKEDAKKLATADADAYVETAEGQSAITELADTKYSNYVNAYYSAIVNQGESFMCMEGLNLDDKDAILDSTGASAWYDWVINKMMNEAAYATGYQRSVTVDNVTAKAWSKNSDWASVSSLDELGAKVSSLSKLLGSVVVSADGTDVSSSKQWMTQAEYDAAEQALSDAQALLDAAGGDYATKLLATTPGQSAVDNAIAALSFEAKAGTKQADDKGDKDDDGDKGDGGGKDDGGDKGDKADGGDGTDKGGKADPVDNGASSDEPATEQTTETVSANGDVVLATTGDSVGVLLIGSSALLVAASVGLVAAKRRLAAMEGKCGRPADTRKER